MKITLDTIFKQPFVEYLLDLGFPVYAVGGCVRDSLLGIESKDVDLIVEGIDYERLQKLLSVYGKVDLVGKSFGVIKFKPVGSEEIIDIAVPRRDSKGTGDGHKAIISEFNPQVTIQDDLKRRDFTINAIALNHKGKYIDPFSGRKDLKNQTIREVDSIAFPEDPLRMLRAVQFAARFKFKIEKDTYLSLIKHKSLIKSITGERVLIEIEKIIEKGDVRYGFMLLRDLGLWEEYFGNTITNLPMLYLVKHTYELMFIVLPQSQEKVFINVLKGDFATSQRIALLQQGSQIKDEEEILQFINRISSGKYSDILDSCCLDSLITNKYLKLKSIGLPLNEGMLAITSQDLLDKGYKGKDLGDKKKELFLKVTKQEINNIKEELLNLL